MLHRLYPAAAAAALLTVPVTAHAAEAVADAPAGPSTTRVQRSFGERGDVILQNIVGVRTSRAPTAGVYPMGSVGGLGALGALGGGAGPSVSAAWFDIASIGTRPNEHSSTRTTTVRFEPSADVFVARHVSVGGSVGFEMTKARFPVGPSPSPNLTLQSTALSVDPRVGYVVPLTDAIALWPRVRAGVTLQQQSYSAGLRSYRVGGDLPLVIRISSHVLLDVGPELTYAAIDLPQHGVVSRSLHVAGRGGLSLAF